MKQKLVGNDIIVYYPLSAWKQNLIILAEAVMFVFIVAAILVGIALTS